MSLIMPICFMCKHYEKKIGAGHYRCAAFERIPNEIMYNEVIHDKPYPGDNDIQYEPLPEYEDYEI